MNRKGFTLIELLAVIVIISLLVIIVLPKITNSVKNFSNKTDELVLSMIKEAAKLYVEDNPNDFEKINGNSYCLQVSKLVEEDYLKVYGEDNNKNITSIIVNYNNGYEYKLSEKENCAACTYEDKDNSGTISFSDIVTCSSESFYVMDNDGTDVTMLTMYNLDVGYISAMENFSFVLKKEIENPTGLQNKKAMGWNGDDSYSNDYYATIPFSNIAYWASSLDTTPTTYELLIDENYLSEGRSYPYVYGNYKNLEGKNQNLAYIHVENYKEKLKEFNVNVKEARLISYEEVNDIIINKGNPSWLYNTTYWTGSVQAQVQSQDLIFVDGIWNVNVDGTVLGDMAGRGSYNGTLFGIRPVIVIHKPSIN